MTTNDLGPAVLRYRVTLSRPAGAPPLPGDPAGGQELRDAVRAMCARACAERVARVEVRRAPEQGGGPLEWLHVDVEFETSLDEVEPTAAAAAAHRIHRLPNSARDVAVALGGDYLSLAALNEGVDDPSRRQVPG